MPRIDLPNGNWAEIRGVDEMKGGDKVAVQRAIVFRTAEDGQNPEFTAAAGEDMQIALLCRIITDWSLDPKPPVTREMIEDLPVTSYNALCDAIQDHIEVIRTAPNRRTRSA